MKLLFAASVLDPDLPFGCTIPWWQIMKGLHELGHEVIATPYFGPSVPSLWWGSYPNPCQGLGNLYEGVRRTTRLAKRVLPGKKSMRKREPVKGSRAQRWVLERYVQPRWLRHLRQILDREAPVDAVVILNLPLNHLGSVPAELRRSHGIPIYYFDGDLPASLPRFGGFDSGFSIYEGADLGQYDGFFSNSLGALESLNQLGVRRSKAIWWGADPGIFRPLVPPTHRETEKPIDVFFYGLGSEYRREWLRDMIAIPSERLPHLRFVVAGGSCDVPLGRAENVGHVPRHQLHALIARSKVHLNIARSTHAEEYASSTARIFELAAMQQCIVSNPMRGMEMWFEPETEILIVDSPASTCQRIEELVANEPKRLEIAAAARARILSHHTYHHRAAEMVAFIAEGRS